MLTKNVCIVVQHYYPKDVRVRKQAMALRSQGHRVSVIALCDINEPKQETVDGVKVYRMALQKKRTGVLRYLFEYVSFFLYSFYKRKTFMDLRRIVSNIRIDEI